MLIYQVGKLFALADRAVTWCMFLTRLEKQGKSIKVEPEFHLKLRHLSLTSHFQV